MPDCVDPVAIGVAARLIAEQRRPRQPPSIAPLADAPRLMPRPPAPPGDPLGARPLPPGLTGRLRHRLPPVYGLPLIPPRPPTRPLAPPTPRQPKLADAPPTWAETRGWRWRDDRMLVGEFRAASMRYRGEIYRLLGDYLAPFIYLPRDAPCLRVGAHAPCFFPVSPGYFRVHLAREAWHDNVDDIIRAVEQALTDT